MTDGMRTKLLCVLLAACALAPNRADAHATRTKQLPREVDGAAVAAAGQDEAPVADEKERRDMRRAYRELLRPRPPKGQRPLPEPRGERPAEFDLVGFTLWEMKPSADTPEEVENRRREGRKFFYGNRRGKSTAYSPVRVGVGGVLVEGLFYRFSVTATRAGYLYLISREEYANGGAGEPELLFPIKRAGGEDNRVRPGRVVEIPNLRDDPGYFEVRRTGRDHTGEILTIIVSETPLKLPSSLDSEPLKLSDRQVAEWEKQWASKVVWADEPEAADPSYTAAEEKAGADAKQLLTEDDPLPQRLYRVPSRPGVPLLVRLRLRYARQ